VITVSANVATVTIIKWMNHRQVHILNSSTLPILVMSLSPSLSHWPYLCQTKIIVSPSAYVDNLQAVRNQMRQQSRKSLYECDEEPGTSPEPITGPGPGNKPWVIHWSEAREQATSDSLDRSYRTSPDPLTGTGLRTGPVPLTDPGPPDFYP